MRLEKEKSIHNTLFIYLRGGALVTSGGCGRGNAGAACRVGEAAIAAGGGGGRGWRRHARGVVLPAALFLTRQFRDLGLFGRLNNLEPKQHKGELSFK
jgi:hypothetical protein